MAGRLRRAAISRGKGASVVAMLTLSNIKRKKRVSPNQTTPVPVWDVLEGLGPVVSMSSRIQFENLRRAGGAAPCRHGDGLAAGESAGARRGAALASICLQICS
ncbi:hypothetical protein EVAR_88749_1 [Eumeta japonica]|uniref:Uncharacterized protein n=1 Tax=Eumeta variegata TaxID=151549 RepID=A0A4C1XW95_EUMVA|nr:hypothetical protein EVAR_88749_1 [Eumeta japonica]